MKKSIAFMTALAFSIIVIGAPATSSQAAANTGDTPPQYSYMARG
ncbi:hypothetical protein EV586_11131 [Tumebacillus sp. BK434]|nr:hypothetical protein [Tumebacillus sp. BK434]TCP52355.1 hypothetical protein EV586_11131 [Tumebacillus sp. BK434]